MFDSSSRTSNPSATRSPSARCARAVPLITLFVLLGGLRLKAWLAGVISLVVALVVAIVLFAMPVGQALLAGTEGAAFGFFPILWIVINAIWVYNLTVASGHFDVLRRSFEKVSPDQRIQAIIIAFCFGALLEALAGFGTPVAITVVMLMALGFQPVKAAAVALIANTAPVAFGALATPIVTLATGHLRREQRPRPRPSTPSARMVGRQTPILAVIVPLILVFVVDGRRGVKQTWLPALVVRRRVRPRAVRRRPTTSRSRWPTSSPRWSRPRPSCCCCASGQPGRGAHRRAGRCGGGRAGAARGPRTGASAPGTGVDGTDRSTGRARSHDSSADVVRRPTRRTS